MGKPMACFIFLFVFLALPIVLAVAPTSPIVKWGSTLVALVFFVWSCLAALFFRWSGLDALPPEIDLPFLPYTIAFLLYAIAACRHWLHPTRGEPVPGFCTRCGYNLTGNVSGICPECGGPVQPSGQHGEGG